MENSEIEKNIRMILRNSARQGKALKMIMLTSGLLLLIFGIIALALMIIAIFEIGNVFTSLGLSMPPMLTTPLVLSFIIDIPMILAGVVLFSDGFFMRVETIKKKKSNEIMGRTEQEKETKGFDSESQSVLIERKE